MAEMTRQFLAKQQECIFRELGSLHDDVSVVSATALRLDNTIAGSAPSFPSRCKAYATR